MHINDVVVHIDETLDPQAMLQLEDRMRELDGVIVPRFSNGRSHLMMVLYNTDRTSTKDVLDVVRSQGYRAQHCGA